MRGSIELPIGLNVPIARMLNTVASQAEDKGLWFIAETAPEAYLQKELRRLHAAVENFAHALLGSPSENLIGSGDSDKESL